MATRSLPAALSALIALMFATPAPAQIRLFKDGQIVKLGPTKAERRARQTGVMLGAMSGRRPMPEPNRSPGAASIQAVPDQGVAGR